MNKKILAGLSALVMCLLLLTSCGQNAPSATPAPTPAPQPTEPSRPTEPPQPAPPEEPDVGADWRVWGLIDGYGTLRLGGETLDLCACLFADRAELYYDRADQTLYDSLKYPVTLSGEDYDRVGIEFLDLSGDGFTDVRVYVEGEFDVPVALTWLWEDGSLVYAPEESYYPQQYVTELRDDSP